MRLSLLLLLLIGLSSRAETPLKHLKIPSGHRLDLAAEVADARQLALGESTLFVGSRARDHVTALRDDDGDGRYERRFRVGSGLDTPNGVAFHDGDLYIAELSRIWRYPAIEQWLPDLPRPQLLTQRLPTARHHGARYLAVGPDGWLYFTIGAPCNSCLSDSPLFATISRLNPSSGRIEVVAQGVRSSGGLSWHPLSRDLWFTDNGPDLLGDKLPDDELNHLTAPGQHFGYPFFYSDDKGRPVADPIYGATARPGDFVPPVLGLGAHVAALGLTFYTGRSLPDADRDTLFIAQHGAPGHKRGYRVVKVQTGQGRQGGALKPKAFISGWLKGQTTLGRPVDVIVDHDGSLLISDDHAGAIYRVSAKR